MDAQNTITLVEFLEKRIDMVLNAPIEIPIIVTVVVWFATRLYYKGTINLLEKQITHSSDNQKENLHKEKLNKPASIKQESIKSSHKPKTSARLKGYLDKRKKEEPLDPEKIVEFYAMIMNRYHSDFEHDIKYIYKDHCKPYISPKEPSDLKFIIKELESFGE